MNRRARLKTAVQDVWQYTALQQVRPLWVLNATEVSNGDLWLVRMSGKQRINPTDWLVRDLDGEPDWVADEVFRRSYEMVT
jgi:hypothetical protein